MNSARRIFALALWMLPAMIARAAASDLSPETLGVMFNTNDANSRNTAQLYAALRGVPPQNLIGIQLPASDSLSPAAFTAIRTEAFTRLPTAVQSLLLVWSRPYAVGCMSITTAFAAGYQPAFCEPGCGLTEPNPLYDSDEWLPADTVGWWPAMLLPVDDPQLARHVIERGISADASSSPGVFYLVSTPDNSRNVRSADYPNAQLLVGNRIRSVQLTEPVAGDIHDAIGYFTGGTQVEELGRIEFRPGAVADHLTSTGGILYGGDQMSALSWLRQGATGSYGTVSEPCNHPEKFPQPSVFMEHYLRGDSLLEAYWKSVAMPGQGLFIGEPLARPLGPRTGHRAASNDSSIVTGEKNGRLVIGLQQKPRI